MSSEAIEKGVKNIKYSFIAQLVVMAAGVIKTLIVPSVLTVESYGYWQIYIFYLAYLGFFHLGFNDGVLLKYGKYDYDKLPFAKIRSSMKIYLAMLFVFSVGLGIYAFTIDNADKRFIILIIAMSIMMSAVYGLLSFVYLITNQIKRYSLYSLLDQSMVLIAVVYIMAAKTPDYRILVLFTFFSKLVMVIVMAVQCKAIFVGKSESLRVGLTEFVENIKFGVMLMMAQIMSMLLTGLGRIFVEHFGNISEYAHYSFGISVVNLVMVCVTAAATVMYPTLSRVDFEALPKYFGDFSRYVTLFNIIALIAYFPANYLVGVAFPEYQPLLAYLYLFFAMLTWQSKVNIVANSYFRVLRKEKELFIINGLGVLFFLVVGLPTVMLTHSIFAVALCTYLTNVFIQIVSEVYLRKNLGISMGREIFHDLLTNLVFICCCTLVSLWIGLAVYAVYIVAFVFFERKNVRKDLSAVIGIVRRK